MTGTITTDEDGRTDAEKTLWGDFLLETIRLDDSYPQPHGVHWLISIADLLMLDIKKIQNQLPDKHPLKSYPLPKLSNEHKLRKKIAKLGADLIASKDIKSKNNPWINLSNLNFTTECVFFNLIFPIDVYFNNTKFSENTYFTNAVFINVANFENAEFHGETANFRGASFEKEADFSKTTFKHYANFKGAKFSDRTIFQQADFKIHAPRFYGAKFNNELILNRIEPPPATKDTLLKVKKTETKEGDTKNDSYQKTTEENKSAYETLIYLMEKQNKHHDKQRFFREEMRWRQLGNILTKERRIEEMQENPPIKYPCFLRLEHNFTIAFFWVYDKVADYGNGIGRALVWWLAHIIVGMIVIASMILIDSWWGCWQHRDSELIKSLSCSISVSFSNANPYAFFGFDSAGLKGCYTRLDTLMPIGFAIVKVIQTIIGVSLLFLLLTTLRVRFRLGGTTSNTTINNTTDTTS